MADSAAPAVPVAATPKKLSKPKSAKKSSPKAAHPKTSDMVTNAIKSLKERGGSSLQAIKKFISANYKVDAEKLSPFIKKYIKGAVTSGDLVQTKGKGASGSFKLPTKGKDEKASAKPKAVQKKPTSKEAAGPPKEKKVKPVAAKKAASKKTVAAKKPAVAKKPKSPSKAKKAIKAPAAAKKPKPKKAVKPKSSPKKAASKKK